jgi:hypothetical protein
LTSRFSCGIDGGLEDKHTPSVDAPVVDGDELLVRDPFAELGAIDPLDFVARLEELFFSDAVYYLRVGQRKQVDSYPVFAWGSPIWVTRRVE